MVVWCIDCIDELPEIDGNFVLFQLETALSFSCLPGTDGVHQWFLAALQSEEAS